MKKTSNAGWWFAAWWTILLLMVVSSCVLVEHADAKSIPIPGTVAAFEDSHAITKYNQPDSYGDTEGGSPTNCCGEADAYWADEFERNEDGEYVAVVTDPRDDKEFRREPEGAARIHVPIGTRVVIPQRKLITFPQQPPNTTGHGWVWLSPYTDENNNVVSWNVICYLAPQGS